MREQPYCLRETPAGLPVRPNEKKEPRGLKATRLLCSICAQRFAIKAANSADIESGTDLVQVQSTERRNHRGPNDSGRQIQLLG
jgi:hypothetical protein